MGDGAIFGAAPYGVRGGKSLIEAPLKGRPTRRTGTA